MDFEWDKNKNQENIVRRGVSFSYAARIFLDGNRIKKIDNRKDYGEKRYIVLGKIEDRIFVVVYTNRINQIQRIISARKANARENKTYYQFQSE